jgi:hypothetical protein
MHEKKLIFQGFHTKDMGPQNLHDFIPNDIIILDDNYEVEVYVTKVNLETCKDILQEVANNPDIVKQSDFLERMNAAIKGET